jgi:hypothetical protein
MMQEGQHAVWAELGRATGIEAVRESPRTLSISGLAEQHVQLPGFFHCSRRFGARQAIVGTIRGNCAVANCRRGFKSAA